MADIVAILNTIKTAVYGEDVRMGIHDGIKFIHDEYGTVQDTIDECHELIAMYEQAVQDAKDLTAKLKDQIAQGNQLKTDLEPYLNLQTILEELKEENQKADTNLQEAREKIPILQALLAQIPDLEQAQSIATQLETAYNNATDALAKLTALLENIEELKAENGKAQELLEQYNQAQQDIQALQESVTELSVTIEGYPAMIEELNSLITQVQELGLDLTEFLRLAQLLEPSMGDITTVAENIELIKQYSSEGGLDLTPIENRLTDLETADHLTSTDLNTLQGEGYWNKAYWGSSADKNTNTPTSSAFGLVVVQISSSITRQIFFDGLGTTYMRNYSSSTWSEWAKLGDTTKLEQRVEALETELAGLADLLETLI